VLGAAPTTPPSWFPLVVVATVLLGARLGGWLVTRVPTDRARALALVLAGTGGAVTLARGLLTL